MPNHTFTIAADAIVLVANHQDPTIVNPDFMKNKGIVPDKWEHTTSVATPEFAHIAYQNGFSVIVQQNRCIFEKKRDNPSEAEYQVYECARKYAEELKYNYVSVGMNWPVTRVQTDPEIWVKNRFLRSGEWQNDLNPKTISFNVPGPDSSTCNFTLQFLPQQPQTNTMQPLILLSCNFDFQLHNVPEKTKQISGILQDVKKYESFLIKKLIKYFEENLK